jgi:hypothetical protein
VTYKSVLLQRIDEFIGELDGVLSARKLVSSAGGCGQVALLPLARCTWTYGEKTCCETSEEGFDSPAPMVKLADGGLWAALRDDAVAGEVGAHAWPTKGR